MIQTLEVAAYNMRMVTEAIAQALASRGRGAQQALADGLGVKAQTVSKWIQHQITPTMDRWPAIEELLDMEPGHLRKISGFGPSETADTETRIRNLEAEVAELKELLRAAGIQPGAPS